MTCNGLDVSVANDPVAALAIVEKFSPEVALLDIGLPEMDGYELARRITETQAGCRLIAVTGYGNENARTRAWEAGFSAYLVKPVAAEMQLSAIFDEKSRFGIGTS